MRDNAGVAYTAGRYILSPTKRFIKFPAMVETVQFTDEYGVHGLSRPAIWSRTADGLAVELECSLQYQVMAKDVLEMYHVLGTFDDAEKYIVQVAQSLIMTEATHYTAHEFFANRTTIAPLIEKELREIFDEQLYAYVQFFQLQKIILPPEFEEAIRNTTLTTQQIAIVEAVRNRRLVEWETELLKMQQHVDVRINEAKAQAKEIELAGQAKGQRIILAAKGDAAAILVKAGATANATRIQKHADAQSILASKATEAATIRLQSQTTFNSTNLSYYLQASSYAAIEEAVGSEERFLELMKVQALQNVSWKKMTVNLAKESDPLAFMGLAS